MLAANSIRKILDLTGKLTGQVVAVCVRSLQKSKIGFTSIREARLPVRSVFVCGMQWKAILVFIFALNFISSSQANVPAGTVIENTATASFNVGGGALVSTSNTAAVTTVRTPASIALYQYTPGNGVVNEEAPSSCRNGNGGQFAVSAAPVTALVGSGATVLDANAPLELSPAVIYHGGDPVFVQVDDPDQNLNPHLADTLMVTLTSTLDDQEDILLTETDLNTGVFIGYVQTGGNALVAFNCELSVSADSSITASYTDTSDDSDSVAASTLVDPYGRVFDSNNGEPVDGVAVTLIDANTGQPAIPGAQIFGDDGVSAYPSTIVSGTSATDSGGNVLLFPSGGYRFPLLLPGRYRLQVAPAAGYAAPSQVQMVDLQGLPNAPFALLRDASYGLTFILNPGPPLHVDIPVDPVTVQLVVEKTASRQDAGIGDFVQYRVAVENVDTGAAARGVIVNDVLPQGFRYQTGSARLDGTPLGEPQIASDGRRLRFSTRDLPAGGRLNLTYVAEITAGAPLGDAINRASATDNLGAASNVSQWAINVRDEFMREHVTLVGRVLVGNCPELPPGEGQAGIRLQAERENDIVSYRADVGIDGVPVSNYRLSIKLPEALQYLPGSSRIDGMALSDPEIHDGVLLYDFGNGGKVWPAVWRHQVGFQVQLKPGHSVSRFEVYAQAQMDTLYMQGQQTEQVVSLLGSEEADSGMQYKSIIGHLPGRASAQVGTELTGLLGARVFMENGAYAVTDAEGKYHFEGVLPGTHVVQLDKSSLPPDVEVLTCEQNTRFAGKAYSRFVDVQGGSLWRVDFHVQQKPPVLSEVSLQMQGGLQNEAAEFEIRQSGGAVPLRNYRLTVMLPEGLQYIAGSSSAGEYALEEPQVREGVLVYRLGDLPDAWQRHIRFKASLVEDAAGHLPVKAFALFDTETEKNLRVAPVETVVYKKQDRFVGKQFVFQPQFASFATDLNAADKNELDRLMVNMQATEIENITVLGHTDNVPISAANQHIYADNYALSKARARAVADYLQTRLHLTPEQVTAQGLGPDQPLADNDSAAGRAQNRRTEVLINTQQRTATGEVSVLREVSKLERVTVSGQAAVAVPAPTPALPKVEKAGIAAYDKNWLNKTEPGVEWLFPTPEFIPAIPAVNVAIKHLPGQRIEAELNGEKLNPLFFFGTERNTADTVARSYWQGIHLQEGSNELRFTVLQGDQSVQVFKREVHFSGAPVRAELVKEYSYLIADGRTSPVLAVKFYDQWGKPVRPGVVGRFTVAEPYFSKEFFEATKKNPLTELGRQTPQYEIGDHGIARIELQPTTQSGKARLQFAFSREQFEEIEAWLKPAQRDWIVVGVADGTLATGSNSGNQDDALAAGFEDGSDYAGKVALFAKGILHDDWLLTAAYDSSKDKQVVGNRLFQTVDPDEFFTLYGDNTEQYYEAASAEKLFAKIEREQFYAMFGDYNTGLNESELSRYNRSVTGLKSEYQGELFSLNTFATETSQRFVKDEIQGNGTSGLYRLSQSNIVLNSETVTIETRDRFRSQDVITRRNLRRHFDYEIDYSDGTLFFKEPVTSRDTNFNPNMIVIDYEVETDLAGEVSGGGRGALHFFDNKLEIGLSAIHDDAFQAQGDLYGADITVKTGERSELTLEFASTDVNDAGVNHKGDAYIAEYRHFTSMLDGRVYMREQEGGFGLGQQASSETATRKYGADGAYRFSDHWRLNGEMYHEDNLASGAQRDVTAIEVGYLQDMTTITGGFRSALDEDANGQEYESEMLLLGAAQGFMRNKLTARFNNEIALNDLDQNAAFPSRHILGLDYMWKPNIAFFTEHEITEGAAQDSNSTRVGVRSSPWARAQINTAIEEQVNEFGPRVFSTLGLTQGFQLNQHWSLDASLDRVDTLRHPGDVPFNLNVPPASGTVNDDFTALSVGASYRNGKSSFVSRLEDRDADSEVKQGYYFGWYRDQAEGIGYSLKAQVFDSEYSSGARAGSGDIRFSLSYRPVASQWIHLNRLDYKFDEEALTSGEEVRSRKIVNNWKGNYMFDRRHQLAFSYGVKYVLDNFDGDEYSGATQLLGSEYRYDIGKRWDLGVHGSVLHSLNADNYTHAFGIDTGWTLVENMWLSVGYNFSGFEDKDFSLAGYTAQGFFVKLRLKFDQHSFHDIFKRERN